MEVSFYVPRSDSLKKYMEGYYFLSDPTNSPTFSYWTFPNNYCIFAATLDSEITVNNSKTEMIPTTGNTVSSSFVYRYIKPLQITITPPINELTIYFKPLGINRFANNLERYYENGVSNSKLFKDFDKNMIEVLSNNDRETQIAQIEDYWLSKLTNRDLSLLESVLADIENGIKIQDIADKNSISRQHLLKLFYKNLGKSVSEYRKVERFRQALKSKNRTNTLTEIAYENQYYDQAHFNKDFKGLTNVKPSIFFQKVDVEKPTIWHFL